MKELSLHSSVVNVLAVTAAGIAKWETALQVGFDSPNNESFLCPSQLEGGVPHLV